ncbi:MAG TPA: superoxide dismutase [Nanoarchaeota archaeon]|nr:superoxide dismutase [Candidatus Woesearchaeota archaeon]HIH15055.1 superoxide dismutase [Nanoarchaeota archaeon]HIH59483.1 superoxide dismutase [Nanoarchaeota archaeon]HII14234.1 superoxide dismutase [Nanoarchaeota archaeon]HIJ04626.1 superoxide dismutase [Nanoarchaeota archaeon]
MAYEAKNYEHLLGMTGMSDTLLKNHFTLYQGYVTNTNKLLDAMMNMVKEGKTASPEFAELKRRFGWEWNGMRMHELYFGNMKKSGQSMSEGELKKSLTHLFGSFENWEKAFKAVGTMRGIGWVVLAYDPEGKKLFNLWINEHDVGHLAGTIPLLIMDVFEHAYMVDYGLKKVDYIETFFRNIDWPLVEKRLNL